VHPPITELIKLRPRARGDEVISVPHGRGLTEVLLGAPSAVVAQDLRPNLSSFYMRDRAILAIPAEYGLCAATGCSGGEMC
jgi:hypothetical protein